ncbi:uncharacterized protein LOC142345320 [Convolutriloba macropyga]|uniref:uncharacterized protein LOC142345320 n=1 Tax=Convolutriloba macropyga TaxID=536237 RepID=UPI003F5254B8
MNASSGDHLGHHSTSNGTSGHTFSGDMRSLKSIQLKLDQLVGEFHSPNREDGFQQMLQKMEQVRNCQQSLCIAHFEMEKTLDRSTDAQTLDDQFRPFDILSGRLTALNDAIKNLHPHQQETNDTATGSGRSTSKYR